MKTKEKKIFIIVVLFFIPLALMWLLGRKIDASKQSFIADKKVNDTRFVYIKKDTLQAILSNQWQFNFENWENDNIIKLKNESDNIITKLTADNQKQILTNFKDFFEINNSRTSIKFKKDTTVSDTVYVYIPVGILTKYKLKNQSTQTMRTTIRNRSR